MTETPGLEALDAGFRAELGPPVEERNALTVSPEQMPVKDLLWAASWLQGEVKRLRCTDPIECGHEAALGQAEAAIDEVMKERDEHEALLDTFAYKIAPVEVIGEHSSVNDPWAEALERLTPAAEVERLRAERLTAVATVAELAQRLTRREREHNADREARDRLHTERDQALAEVERLTAELAAIRAHAHARSEELLTARDQRPSDDRVKRRAFEFAAHEVRKLVEPPTTTEEGK